jgi:hypothetical protein
VHLTILFIEIAFISGKPDILLLSVKIGGDFLQLHYLAHDIRGLARDLPELLAFLAAGRKGKFTNLLVSGLLFCGRNIHREKKNKDYLKCESVAKPLFEAYRFVPK